LQNLAALMHDKQLWDIKVQARGIGFLVRNESWEAFFASRPGLPDFSRHNIPKLEKYSRMMTNYTKLS
jgi:hypothetical protein